MRKTILQGSLYFIYRKRKDGSKVIDESVTESEAGM